MKNFIYASYVLISTVLTSSICFAQTPSGVPSPSPTVNQFDIQYGSNEWNTSSKEIDSAYMFVREKSKSRVAKILMEETEPDSAVFKGRFSIDWKDANPDQMEVFVPAKSIRKNEKFLKTFSQKVTSGELAPQPLIIKNDAGRRTLDVYDSIEQLDRAKKLYEEQLQAEAEVERMKIVQEETLKKRVIETAEAQHRAKMARLAAEASAREADRQRRENLEKSKREDRIKKSLELKAAERQKRVLQAEKLASEGQVFYDENNYNRAEESFRKATELDPSNSSFYFLYGVSLYRNEKFNDALVILNLAGDNEEADLEKQYYISLIHYRQKEYKLAVENFEKVKIAGSKELSPSAAFYQGLSQFSIEDFEPAKKNFEWVVDNADDPKLAEKAEEYIEKVSKAIAYKKMKDRKWKISAKGGINYDSNILYSPDADDSSASSTDKDGFRIMLQTDVERRFFVRENDDWAAKWSSYYVYSIDDEFSINDPWMNTISLPYSYKSTWGSKGTQIILTPAIESILMDNNEDGNRENVQNGLIGSAEITLINTADWFSTYFFEARSDDSKLPDSGEDNNADALKYSLRTYQTRLIDKTKTTALVGSAGIVLNDAKGKENYFQRLELGATYAAPLKKLKNTNWALGLAIYQQDFSKSDLGREDFNMAVNYTLTKALNDRWSVLGIASYTSNTSSLDASQYTKYQVTSQAIYTWIE